MVQAAVPLVQHPPDRRHVPQRQRVQRRARHPADASAVPKRQRWPRRRRDPAIIIIPHRGHHEAGPEGVGGRDEAQLGAGALLPQRAQQGLVLPRVGVGRRLEPQGDGGAAGQGGQIQTQGGRVVGGRGPARDVGAAEVDLEGEGEGDLRCDGGDGGVAGCDVVWGAGDADDEGLARRRGGKVGRELADHVQVALEGDGGVAQGVEGGSVRCVRRADAAGRGGPSWLIWEGICVSVWGVGGAGVEKGEAVPLWLVVESGEQRRSGRHGSR